MKTKLFSRPFLLFSPLLIFYDLYILKYKWPELFGDEPRYLMFASNLLHGFYSPSAPDINLWNGPGYPIILMPFVALHSPVIFIPLMNGIFQYLSVVFLYKSLISAVKVKLAFAFTLAWVFYFNAYIVLPAILTETFTNMLVALLLYLIVQLNIKNKIAYVWLCGLVLGYLTLTKIIFGYVLIIGLVSLLLLLVFKTSPAASLLFYLYFPDRFFSNSSLSGIYLWAYRKDVILGKFRWYESLLDE